MAATTRLIPPERRGLATGIVNAGGSFGQFIMAPIAAALMVGLGWANAMQVMGLLVLLALPAAFLLKGNSLQAAPAGQKVVGTREAIGREKAGIFRAATPAICADPRPPRAVIEHAEQIGARLLCLGQDFGFAKQEDSPQWNFWLGGARRSALPIPALRGGYQLANASAALAALEAVRQQLPVGMGDIRRGLLEVEWPGRFQVLPGRPVTVLDVGHNPHAIRAMVSSLQTLNYAERRLAVFSMLADKDVDSVIELAKDEFDEWWVAPIADSPRAMPVAGLVAKLHGARRYGHVTADH